MLGVREIKVIMRVRVHEIVSICVSHAECVTLSEIHQYKIKNLSLLQSFYSSMGIIIAMKLWHNVNLFTQFHIYE